MISVSRQVIALTSTLALSSMLFHAGAQTSTSTIAVEKGYSISVFAKGVAGKYTKPDSIAVSGDHIYIAYGDSGDPAGLDAKPNQIIEYSKDGHVLYTYNVIGHNDGLKVDPRTHKIWAMQNEDGNPNLVIIDPQTRQQTLYTFNAQGAGGGGYDDITFRNSSVYFSASNPSNNPNTLPAIVKAHFVGNTINVEPVLEGNAGATNVVTGAPATLNLQDPDSMTVTPSNDLLLDSQGDSELVLVSKVGTAGQSALLIPLSSPLGVPQADDTIFAASNDGFILVSDTPANTVYAIYKTSYTPGTAYTAAVAGTTATPGFVGKLDLDNGQLTTIVSGLQSPHGMAFFNARDTNSNDPKDACPVLP